jgi:CHAT domain-containing protein
MRITLRPARPGPSCAASLIFAALLGAGLSAQAALLVDGAGPGWAAQRGGARSGDVLIEVETARGRQPLRSPFDVRLLETTEGTRGPTTLHVRRGGADLRLSIPAGRWDLFTRPDLAGAARAAWSRATAQQQAGELDAAVASWRDAARQVSAWRDRAAVWLRVGQLCADARRWPEAQGAYVEATGLLEGHGARREAAAVFAWESEQLAEHARVQEAEQASRAALAILEKGGPEDLFLAHVLTGLGRVLLARGHLKAADETLRRALAISKGLAPESLTVSADLVSLGRAAREREDYEEQDRLYKEAYDLRAKVAPDSREVAESLGTLTWLVATDISTSEGYARRSVELLEALAPTSAEMAAAYGGLGVIHWVMGDLAPAERQLQRALDLFTIEAPDGIGLAETLDSMGVVLMDRGDLDAAERAFRQSSALFDRVAPNTRLFFLTLRDLGTAATRRHDWPRAEQLFTRSVDAIRTQARSRDLAVSLYGRAWALIAQGRLDEARRDSQEALDILRNLSFAEPYYLGEALINHGDLLLRTGDLDGAEEAYCEATDLLTNLTPNSLLIESLRSKLAEVRLRRGDLDGAQALLESALVRLSSDIPATSLNAEALYRLATVRRRQKRWPEAADLYGRAVDAVEAQTGRVGGTEEARAGFSADAKEYYVDYIDALLQQGRNEEAFRGTERYRARRFLAELAERDLSFSEDLPPELVREWKDLEAQYSHVQTDLLQSRAAADSPEREGLRTQLRELTGSRETMKRRVRDASPRVASLRYPEPLAAAETASLLDPGTALLSFVVGPHETLLFAISPTAAGRSRLDVLRLPIDEAELRSQITDFRELIRTQGSLTEVTAAANRLYRALLAPAEPLLGRAQRLLVIADGPLHRLPFAALVPRIANGRAEYLIERWAVHNVLSATVYAGLVQARAAPEARDALVAFGDPVYTSVSGQDAVRLADANLRSAIGITSGLSPLPFSRREVETIRDLFPGHASIFVGAAATEEEAKRQARGARYLHFACHSVVDEDFPINSGLVLTVPAAPRDGEDDGILQAWEIIDKVRLSARLVTLSACETGLGKDEAGEGLVGLTRAFLYSGAQSVLASLWAVSDESTAQLMKRIYGHLRSGTSVAEALRGAQVEMLRGDASPATPDTARGVGRLSVAPAAMNAHPFRWASFQLVGDWR